VRRRWQGRERAVDLHQQLPQFPKRHIVKEDDQAVGRQYRGGAGWALPTQYPAHSPSGKLTRGVSLDA
jgi:hypothetical protein